MFLLRRWSGFVRVKGKGYYVSGTFLVVRVELHCCEAHGVGRVDLEIKRLLDRRPMLQTNRRFFLCLRNDGYAASLRPRTVYEGIADRAADSHGMLRIVDESGEDFLFPAGLFVPVDVSD